MFLSSNLLEKEVALLVDVGSSSIGAALVLTGPGSSPHVIASRRNSLDFQDEINFSRFFDSMVNTLRLTVNEVIPLIPKRPEKVYCFLASPWYASQIRTIKTQKEREYEFTKKIFDDLVAKEVKEFEASEIAKLKNAKTAVNFIENKAIDVKINGYRVEDPFGKLAREVEISLFFGMAPEKVVTSIRECFYKIIPETNILFHTFLLPFFAVARDLFLDTADFLLIDVGGEVTDVSLARDRVLSGAISFPLGKNFLLRSASEVLKKDAPEAESLIKMLLLEKLDENAKREVETALIPARTLWLKSFHEALEDITSELSLPDRIFLTVDGDIEKWFVDTIKTEEYGQYTLTSDKFRVTVVEMSIMENYLSFNDTIEERDQFLSLEALFTKLQ